MAPTGAVLMCWSHLAVTFARDLTHHNCPFILLLCKAGGLLGPAAMQKERKEVLVWTALMPCPWASPGCSPGALQPLPSCRMSAD